MESSNANGVPVIVYTQPMPTGGAAVGAPHLNTARIKKLEKKLTNLGWLHIVFGSVLILTQIIAMVPAGGFYGHDVFTFMGYGIWIGVFFVITGSFGCAAGKRNNRGFMITFNVMSIISASLNAFLVSRVVLSMGFLGSFVPYHTYYGGASIAMESVMIILKLAETIVAIWSSVVCCKMGICCCDCGGACCCPPDPVPIQGFLMQQPPIDGTPKQQKQPLLVYADSASKPSANDV